MVAVTIFISINFKILNIWRDDLVSYNFYSQISILPEYLGAANRANLCNVMTGPVYCLLQKYLCELLKAMKDDGCNAIGYTLWALMDKFEWMVGYK
jgi:hypothetical protein